MISHIGTSWALLAFNLELGDLASGVDIEVLKKSLGSLFVLVSDFLGFGIDLLLSLLFTSQKSEGQANGVI